MARTMTAAVASLALLALLALRARHGAQSARGVHREGCKQRRREQQRELRRVRKDENLARKKAEKSVAREQQQQRMTDEQRREQMERIKMQRVEQYQKIDDGYATGLRVVVDLAYAADQTERECHSILKQLGCVYGYMKKCPLDRVISLRVTSFCGAIATAAQQRGLASWKIHVHARPLDRVYRLEEIVYLSPDAVDVLTELDASSVYVVGGIVDRSVRKGQSLEQAVTRRVRAVRLPLEQYVDVRKPVLNIDAVLIALNEFANHGDWERAFERAVPKRMAQSRRPNTAKKEDEAIKN